jgi:hypothetical protein
MRQVSGSLFTFAAGRRTKWVVFGIWFLAIFIAAGPAELPAKFEDAESNEATSYLPGSAESTDALDATEELQNGELAPAVIVYRRESGLTAGDRRTIVEDVGKMTQERFPEWSPTGKRPRPGQRGQRAGQSNAPGRTARMRHPHQHHSRPTGRLRPVRRTDLLRRRQGGDRHRLINAEGEGEKHP